MSREDLNTDQYLWQAVINSDEQAFTELYQKYSSTLYIVAFKLLKNKEACEDIIQDVFVHLWLRRGKLHILNIKSYLYRAVKNKVIDLVRKNKYHIELDEVQELIASECADSALLNKEIESAIEKSVNELPAKCAQIISLKKNQSLSNKEIAEQLNISTKTVENQTTIAIKKLKISLANKLTNSFLLFFFYFL
ncbi:RNA polymerase sigma-70 factor [Sphingobacterium chuzhouense]|uniref:RNA polymerase sigma-70 factor n=1 Tax=Sphingobacterium chuzhouense TaxID=1742264 RepID=A0ABR7XPC0_9SPHI|nr:RNA polymerase sigma-70 factor [Sphingobacterium chuzhouense]MBD1420122.1 RNA polymerase sigma-70 factor [Sphingobacterium chuzhouense]